MAPDYAKMKNAELEGLLKSRGLPHTGKKADLVARLQDDDAKQAAKTADNPEDEIDWDDDAVDEPAKPAEAAAPVEVAKPEETNRAEETGAPAPAATTTTTTNGATTTTEDQPAEAPAPATDSTPAPPAPTSIDVSAELQKRLDRIDKFTNQQDPDSVKWAEEEKAKIRRLQKFGGDSADADSNLANEKLSKQVASLDSALPERREKRKRGGQDDGGNARGGKFRRGGRFRDGGRRPFKGGRGGGGPRRENGERGGERREGGYPSWMSDKDRAAAEARKSKWAA